MLAELVLVFQFGPYKYLDYQDYDMKMILDMVLLSITLKCAMIE